MEWYLVALGSAFFSAIAAILEKKILFKNGALSLSFILAIFNFLIVIPFFFFIDYSALSVLSLSVLFLKSVLGAFAFLLVMLGIKDLEISRALPLLVLTPGLVAFFAWIFLGDTLNAMEIGGMVLLLIGTYILQADKFKSLYSPIRSFLTTRGNYYILGALALFTTTSVLDKALLGKFSVPLNAFMGFQHLFIAIVFLVLVLFYSDKKNIVKSFKFSWGLILILALLTIVYRYSQLYAVRIAPVALVLAMKRVSVFFAVLIGGAMFRDRHLWLRVLSTGIMIAGAVLIIVA